MPQSEVNTDKAAGTPELQGNKPDQLFVAGVGASAGGLEALERFFRTMPADTGIAFVVIQHLSPDFKSVMDELLARHTRMPIHRVVDGMTVEANSVYLIPPRKEMIISGGRLLLTDKDPAQDLTLPIDHFFRSLAHDVGRRAIAIVLSGTGSDGSRGIRDVHEAGGLVIVQNAETAKFDGMPRSAVDTGCVDANLSPDEMAPFLLEHLQQRAADPDSEARRQEENPADVRGVDAIFKLLRDEYGIDFSYYKPNTVSRRIERRLSLNQSLDLDQYVEHVRSDSAELNSLYKDLLIGVTRFFRDRDAFDYLERVVLPEILSRKRPEEELRFWVAGCATGEEPYSLAILLHEQLKLLGRPINAKIFATDVHGASLDIASIGIYREEALAEVPPARLAAYFTRKGDGYQVIPEVRQMIVFAHHNVIKDAPFTKLDLISCRNLLIYFQPLAQKKVLSLFHFGLRTGGTLFLGPSESPGELAPEFDAIDEHWKLYRKRRDVRLPPDLRLPLIGSPPHIRVSPGQSGGMDASLLAAYDRLLDEYMPAGLLVTDRRQLVHAFGGAGKFLTQRDGRPTGDILDMVDGPLKLALAGSLQRAAKDLSPVVYSGMRLMTAEGEGHYRLSVKPLLNAQRNLTHLFIALEDLDASGAAQGPPTEIDANEASRAHLSSIEAELRHTRENLQATIEELETSNEELQASNEELVASNEELQSTNEELHSVNEELYTVNAEYQKKISELTELTDDMDNLLRSTDIATIFLDQHLCIRKFTPQVGRIFDLLPQDLGRRIDSFSHQIMYAGLHDDVAAVLRSGTPIEKEVRHRNGSWYFLRILPYSSHVKLDGVVLAMIDVSALKKTEATLEQMSAIVASSDDAIIGMDLASHITSWNQGAQALYGYAAEEVVGKPTAILRPHGDKDPGIDWPQEVMDRMRVGMPANYRVEVVRRRKNGTLVDVLITISPIRDAEGKLVGVSKIARDITDHKLAVEALKLAEEDARESVRRRDKFLAMLSHELRNPLAAVVNAAHLLEGREPDDDILDMAHGTIRRQSQHMARLLDDLLDISRITRDKIEIRKQIVDLRQTTRDAMEVVKPLLENHPLQLHIDLPPQPVRVSGDPARLQQIQVNLLNNAIKYTPAGGRIWYSLRRDGNDAIVMVRDTGAGIPPDMHEKIFELFVQLDGPNGMPAQGMGVGLTLVRSLVRLHGGNVDVASAGPGKGSTFTVRLPLSHVQHETPAAPLVSANIPRGLRVLLVDDNSDIRSVTRRLLATMGCEVYIADCGTKGIELLLRHAPEVALIDIGMPEVDGYEVARRIRQELKNLSVRLVAVTGFGQHTDRQRALESGFDAHLIKPVDIEELRQTLSKVRVAQAAASHAGGPEGER